MHLFDALHNMLHRADRAAADALANPVKDEKTRIEDCKTIIRKNSEGIRDVKAATLDLQRQYNEALAKVTENQGYAIAAAKAGNESDASLALTEKAKHQAIAEGLQGEITRGNELVAKLLAQLNAAKQRVADDERDLAGLAAREQSAELRKAMATSGDTLDEGPFRQDHTLRDKVLHDESLAEATEEINTDPQADALKDLHAKYSGQTTNVSAELAALMAEHAPGQ